MEHATGPEVLGVGWPRTGTSSLKLALDGLGFGPCFHGRFIPYLPEVRQRCYAYATERDTVFPTREVFAAYRAAVDIPPGLIPHLLEAYPQAKVILTMRDADSWCTSMQNVIVRLYYWLLLPFFWTTRLGREYTAIIGWSLRCMFKGDLSRQSCIRAFHAHNESVRASVPAERLLLWRPQDGWEPLARFLDVPVPEAPFPQPQNEGSAEMLRQVGAFIWRYPLASVGLAQHSHQGPLTFEAIK